MSEFASFLPFLSRAVPVPLKYILFDKNSRLIRMRDEVKDWWEQAQHDSQSALKISKIGEYHIAAFLCHQACEKGLKALFLFKKKESAGMTHSLVFMAKELAAPASILSVLRDLTPDFTFINSAPEYRALRARVNAALSPSW